MAAQEETQNKECLPFIYFWVNNLRNDYTREIHSIVVYFKVRHQNINNISYISILLRKLNEIIENKIGMTFRQNFDKLLPCTTTNISILNGKIN